MAFSKSWQPFSAVIIVLATLALMTLVFKDAGFAQQTEFAPPPSVQRNQAQGGSVLEVPTIPRRQSGEADTVPQLGSQQGQELTLPSRRLSRQPGYEQVTVTIINQQGRYVTGLQKNDFKLFIDGPEHSIDFFRQDLNTPVSIGILVDTSGSMDSKLPQAKLAIAEFVKDLNPRDDVFLFAFSDSPFLLQPFTTDHQAVIGRLSLLYAQGQTAIFDTVIDGLLMVRHGRWDKKALLVVTDGQDNASGYSLENVVAQARRMGVLIYSIGIGDSNVSPMASFNPVFPIGYDQVDARTLETLSAETGAKTYLLRTIGDGQKMRDDCLAISQELREQYTLGFVAPDAGHGGYRNVRVDVPSHPYDHVRVRKGIEIGSPGRESASIEPGRGAP